MVEKKTTGEKIFDIFNYLFMLALMLITIYPLLYVSFASISDPTMLMNHKGLLLYPLGNLNLKGYELTFKNPSILIGYRNTIGYVFIGTLVNLIFTSICAFILSRKHFYIRKIMTKIIMFTMFFSGGLIPMFFVIKTLNIYDNPLALILPGAIETFNMIIMRTFFLGIPESLEESAVIDGATDFNVFTKIIIPLSKPVIAVMVLYYGVSHWNSWFGALVFIRNRSFYPLQLFLREILVLGNSDSGTQGLQQMAEESLYKELIKYCTIMVSTIPILMVYPFLQKYFVKGVMIGAVKG